MSNKSFGQLLKEKREEARLTQSELARLARSSKQYIYNLENNVPHPISGARPRPSRAKVEALAIALDWTLTEALPAAGYAPPEGEGPKEDFEKSEFAALFYDYKHRLTAQDRRELAAILNAFKAEVRRRRRERASSKEQT